MILIGLPAVTCYAQEPVDTLVETLDEISVSTKAPRKVIDSREGTVALSSRTLSEMPKFMGHADPMRAFQTLPQVATNGDISAGIYVEGCDQSQNRIAIDGARVINPTHMLGLFPVFNADHFKGFTMRSNAHPTSAQNFIGGDIEASTMARPDTILSGTATVGLIDASATVRIPIEKSRDMLLFSARGSYLDKVLPNAIKVDHASLKYGFEDINATYIRAIGSGTLRANFFFSDDHLKMDEQNFNAGGRFGWHNILGSVGYSDSRTEHLLSVADYSNTFRLDQNSMTIKLPSSITEAVYRGLMRAGDFVYEADMAGRWVREQYSEREFGGQLPARKFAFEGSLSAAWHRQVNTWLNIDAGLRGTVYTNGGYTRVYPMPRLRLRFSLPAGLNLTAYYGKLAQFTHMVNESGTGLPTDFFISASRQFKPETAHAVTLGLGGRMGNILSFNIGGYYRRLYNLTEYNGSILNMVNASYTPLSDLLTGNGDAYGVAITLTRDFGPVRGWIGYNLGHSMARFDELGDRWFPTNHDRRHDLTATASWDMSERVSLSASFAYASGNPYTEAAYGYLLGENFILEYFPHNSSRMPDYKRLDLSMDWVVWKGKRCRHRLNVALYNALMMHNVLFVYTSYNPVNGVSERQSKMKTIIPSLSYTIEF